MPSKNDQNEIKTNSKHAQDVYSSHLHIHFSMKKKTCHVKYISEHSPTVIEFSSPFCAENKAQSQ